MAVTIPILQEIANDLSAKKDHVFKDLHLDFRKDGRFDPVTQKFVETNDIKVSYDLAAIKNSLYNLFTTKPGQRFLFPEYGLPLEKFIFEAITPENAEIVGEAVVRAVERFETRVKVEMCTVKSEPDDHRYDIDLLFSVPLFDSSDRLSMKIDQNTQNLQHI